MINIKGLDKAAVLAALYNASEPIGLGVLRAKPGDMTIEEARAVISSGDDHAEALAGLGSKRVLYFDYVHGRQLKVDLNKDEFDEWLFDRDAGQGAAERAIAALRASTVTP